MRNDIISGFINSWKENVGNNIYPALRLILPDHDKERPIYGIKEKALAKLFIKVLDLARDSGDATALMEWKGGHMGSAGVFSDKCYEVLMKRSTHTSYSELTIDDVNSMLDELAQETEGSNTFKEKEAVIKRFANVMSPEELRWLIRIILKYLRIGATERTVFNNFHPDAFDLFNVTSDLKLVCWRLYDVNYRLPSEQHQISLMRCFQPQLAAFNKHSAKKIVESMPETGFYIEEKMDGERIQIHMDNGKFKFWSRKAKDYTYLYGDSYEAFNGKGFTAMLKGALRPEVRNVILDGEMVGWDTEEEAVVPFGHLKTASINVKEGGSGTTRALFLAFDILYLNDTVLVDYSLADRKRALERAVAKSIPGCFSVLPYRHGTRAEEIQEMFRKVIEEASEGLIIKNPESPYRINERINSWVKLKPDYLEELGEKVDVCVIGGYNGSGRRAGRLSSYLCGVRVTGHLFHSFCRVGGGITAVDYAEIRHLTDGKWHQVSKDSKGHPTNIPSHLIELQAGAEVPDCWIDPTESIVLEIKAAEIIPSKSFKTGYTLRFPRYERIRKDKDWQSSMSLDEFTTLRAEVKDLQLQKEVEIENFKIRKQVTAGKKRRLRLRGDSGINLANVVATSILFAGKKFYIAADIMSPKRMTKGEVEKLVKSFGASITQNSKGEDTIIIADREKLPAARAISRAGSADVVKPDWIFECIDYKRILDFEPEDFLYARKETEEKVSQRVDEFGDSYTRNTSPQQLLELLTSMDISRVEPPSETEIKELKYKLADIVPGKQMRGLLFTNCVVYFDGNVYQVGYLKALAELGGAQVAQTPNAKITHVITTAKNARKLRPKFPQSRMVTPAWLRDCWSQGVRISEDKYTA